MTQPLVMPPTSAFPITHRSQSPSLLHPLPSQSSQHPGGILPSRPQPFHIFWGTRKSYSEEDIRTSLTQLIPSIIQALFLPTRPRVYMVVYGLGFTGNSWTIGAAWVWESAICTVVSQWWSCSHCFLPPWTPGNDWHCVSVCHQMEMLSQPTKVGSSCLWRHMVDQWP